MTQGGSHFCGIYFFRPFPAGFWNAIRTGATRLGGLSPYCHCAIAYNGVLLDVSYSNGVAYFPVGTIEKHHPSLSVVFSVPVLREPDLAAWEPYHGVPLRVLPTVGRFLLGGGPFVYDCVCIVLYCLETGGVHADPGITTPGALYRWCVRQGFPYVAR